MPLLRRLLGRTTVPDKATTAGVNLVSTAVPVKLPRREPSPLGITTELVALPWTVTRIAGIFRDLARQPSEQTLREARYARHCLSLFWLTAPLDQLQTLYAGPVGQIYGLMLEGVLPSQPLAVDELAWRNGLQRRLMDEFERPERLNLVLAVMPYFPPGGMTVAQASGTLPDWLLLDYARFCEPELEQRLRQPVGLLHKSKPSTLSQPTTTDISATAAVPPPAHPPEVALPVLAELRGAKAMERLQGNAYRERMLGLIHRYALDQRDGEIVAELVQLRRQLGQLWLDVVPDQLEKLFRSPVGDLYRQLLASPFTAAPLTEEDRALRGQLAELVADLSREGALNALLAALPFFPPQKVELEGGAEFIPDWLLEVMQQR